VDRFTELFELIAAQPELGEQFGDPRRQVRRTSLGNYVVVYQLLPEGVVIVRVLHGAQDWQALLRSFDPGLD
jgi:toxin ParE1/3/4